MSYLRKDISFLSSDGVHNVHAELYIPENKEIRAVIQVAHGMMDYIGRYTRLAEAFTDCGFVLAGNDHLGHGDTALSEDERGYFAKKEGYSFVIGDLLKMNGILHEKFADIPLVLFGHSMGSFISRLYAASYPDTIDALIIHGTAGPNPAAPAGRVLVKLMKLAFGDMHRSPFVCSMADGGYNKSFDKSEGDGAWLTRDAATVADRPTNKKTNFIFTLSGYDDLFYMLTKCNSKEWFESYPKNLPTLVVSGSMDPVGDFGKGVGYVYDKLKKCGASVELKLYEGARHELFNETNREEVFADLAKWIERNTLG